MRINLKMCLLVECCCAQGCMMEIHVRNKPEAVFDCWMLCAWVYVPDGDAHRNKPKDVLDSCMLLCAGGVYRAEKHTGANLKMLVQGLSTRPMGIIAYSASRQKCECAVVTCLWTAATSALDPVTMVLFLFSFGIIMIVKVQNYGDINDGEMNITKCQPRYALSAVDSDFLFRRKRMRWPCL